MERIDDETRSKPLDRWQSPVALQLTREGEALVKARRLARAATGFEETWCRTASRVSGGQNSRTSGHSVVMYNVASEGLVACPESKDVTTLLLEWGGGKRQALDELLPLVYGQLRQLAARQLRRERPNHTLHSTALVHEAYLKLIDLTDLVVAAVFTGGTGQTGNRRCRGRSGAECSSGTEELQFWPAFG